MRAVWIVGLLVACGGKSDDGKPATAPPSTPAPMASPDAARAVVPVDAAPRATPLDEAIALATKRKHTKPHVWVAIAHAQAIAKQTDAAKATLATALAAARKTPNDEGATALVGGVEVYLALGDDAAAAALLDEAVGAIGKMTFPTQLLRGLFAADSTIAHPPLLEKLAHLAVTKANVVEVIERVRIGSPAWKAVVEEVRAQPDATLRVRRLADLAHYARQSGQHALALGLANDAAGIVRGRPADHDTITLATELAMLGDKAGARKVAAHMPARAAAEAKDDPAAAAITYAQLVELHALLGDKAASEAFEEKLRPVAARGKEELDETLPVGIKQADDVAIPLAVAHVLRGDRPVAVKIARKLPPDRIDELAWVLVDLDQPDAATPMLAMLRGDRLDDAVRDIVALEALRPDLEAARTRAAAAKKNLGAWSSILRAFAYRGDVAAIDAFPGGLLPSMFRATAGRVLARDGKCDEAKNAVASTSEDRAETLAVLARFCPDARFDIR